MNKKIQTNKVDVLEDLELKRAWQYYSVGNFYRARALARKILVSKEGVAAREQAARIMRMCSADPWAVASGFIVLIFTLVVAYVVAF